MCQLLETWYHGPEKHKLNIQEISVASDGIYCLIFISPTLYVFPAQEK
jgi:hypothetical protein